MKVNGFFKDVTGAMRVTKRRNDLFRNASSEFNRKDNIGEVARALHPGKTNLLLESIVPASPTSYTLKFTTLDKKLPVFQAGQYISLDVELENTVTTRPYSISSAPFETRTDNPFVEVTVRNKGETYIADYLSTLKPGDKLSASMPYGQFYYEPLRDSKDVVAIAGGSGITPFFSMAREIENGKLDCNLTILYGSNDLGDIVLRERLDQIKSDKVKVVYVISNDESWTGEKGFITEKLIRKYSGEDSTYFLCGPQAMYNFVLGELEKMKVPHRRIRKEVFGTPKNLLGLQDYPAEKINDTYNLTVVRGIRKDIITASADETVAVALERAGIKVETRCRSGECGYCRSELMEGEIYVCKDGDGRRQADKIHGFFHPCSSYPLSDITVKVPIL